MRTITRAKNKSVRWNFVSLGNSVLTPEFQSNELVEFCKFEIGAGPQQVSASIFKNLVCGVAKL
jgi:hypothetical protein